MDPAIERSLEEARDWNGEGLPPSPPPSPNMVVVKGFDPWGVLQRRANRENRLARREWQCAMEAWENAIETRRHEAAAKAVNQ